MAKHTGRMDPLMDRAPRITLNADADHVRALVENGNDIVALLDGAARIVYTTPSFERELGWKSSEVIGLIVTELAHAEDRRALERLVRQASTTPNRALRGEVRIVARGGGVRILDVGFSNQLQSLGAIVCNATDVTLQKELRARLIDSDRMASLGTLAASVAHEINNPLSALIGNLHLLADDLSRSSSPPEASLTGLLAEAQEAAERVRVIAKDLNLFSRKEQDHFGFVDVQRLLDSSLRMSRNEVRHRARVVKRYEHVPPVYTNESRLGQVFVNLLVNAAQAIPEGRAHENEIRVSTRVDGGGRAVVEISDTGSGISPDILARVFDPFFTTKPAGLGTGLGLAICRSILAEMGGSIDVSSTVDRGSTFSVTLPITDAPDESDERREPPAAHASRRGKVLIIDDEALVRTYVARALEEHHDVVSEASATQALARIRRGTRFDAIICDVMMPDVTGVDFYQQLTSVAPELRTRVIFLTGGAFSARARRFLQTMDNPVIEKPFEPAGLRSIVNRVVG